ncbi:hypothetical protein [Rhizohabitans arisaemae]|uniref:hypothetical protein n=1 Tax=Rhizohabitans arisaemae TaxID=2720610 RepID=UPI0024B1A535|nr:hypothetical protein [Rhizohabitans arisaemae]
MNVTIRIGRRVLLVAILGAATGCSTRWERKPSEPVSPEGALASKGEMYVENVSVLGPEPTQTVPAGASLPVVFAMINKGKAPDRLLSMSAPGAAESGTLSPAPVTVPPGTSVWVGAAVRASLRGVVKPLQVGDFVAVHLRFERVGELVVPDVVIRPASYSSTLPRSPGAS